MGNFERMIKRGGWEYERSCLCVASVRVNCRMREEGQDVCVSSLSAFKYSDYLLDIVSIVPINCK